MAVSLREHRATSMPASSEPQRARTLGHSHHMKRQIRLSRQLQTLITSELLVWKPLLDKVMAAVFQLRLKKESSLWMTQRSKCLPKNLGLEHDINMWPASGRATPYNPIFDFSVACRYIYHIRAWCWGYLLVAIGFGVAQGSRRTNLFNANLEAQKICTNAI